MNRSNDSTQDPKPQRPASASLRPKRPYRSPVLRSTTAFEKLALQSCAPADKFPAGDCLET